MLMQTLCLFRLNYMSYTGFKRFGCDLLTERSNQHKHTVYLSYPLKWKSLTTYTKQKPKTLLVNNSVTPNFTDWHRFSLPGILISNRDMQMFSIYGHVELFYEFKLSNRATFCSVCENNVFTETQDLYAPEAAMYSTHTQRYGCL